MTDQGDQKFTHRTDDGENHLYIPIAYHEAEIGRDWQWFALPDSEIEDLSDELSRYIDRHL